MAVRIGLVLSDKIFICNVHLGIVRTPGTFKHAPIVRVKKTNIRYEASCNQPISSGQNNCCPVNLLNLTISILSIHKYHLQHQVRFKQHARVHDSSPPTSDNLMVRLQITRPFKPNPSSTLSQLFNTKIASVSVTLCIKYLWARNCFPV